MRDQRGNGSILSRNRHRPVTPGTGLAGLTSRTVAGNDRDHRKMQADGKPEAQPHLRQLGQPAAHGATPSGNTATSTAPIVPAAPVTFLMITASPSACAGV